MSAANALRHRFTSIDGVLQQRAIPIQLFLDNRLVSEMLLEALDESLDWLQPHVVQFGFGTTIELDELHVWSKDAEVLEAKHPASCGAGVVARLQFDSQHETLPALEQPCPSGGNATVVLHNNSNSTATFVPSLAPFGEHSDVTRASLGLFFMSAWCSRVSARPVSSRVKKGQIRSHLLLRIIPKQTFAVQETGIRSQRRAASLCHFPACQSTLSGL